MNLKEKRQSKFTKTPHAKQADLASQLRRYKRRVRELERELEHRSRLNLIATMMANVCYNLKQDDRIPPEIREMLGDLQKQWDTVRDTRRKVTG